MGMQEKKDEGKNAGQMMVAGPSLSRLSLFLVQQTSSQSSP
jgi:hypothetical protein